MMLRDTTKLGGGNDATGADAGASGSGGYTPYTNGSGTPSPTPQNATNTSGIEVLSGGIITHYTNFIPGTATGSTSGTGEQFTNTQVTSSGGSAGSGTGSSGSAAGGGTSGSGAATPSAFNQVLEMVRRQLQMGRVAVPQQQVGEPILIAPAQQGSKPNYLVTVLVLAAIAGAWYWWRHRQ